MFAARDHALTFLHAFEHFPEIIAGTAKNYAPLLIRAVALIDVDARIVAGPKDRGLRNSNDFRRLQLHRPFRIKLVSQFAIWVVDLDPNTR